MTRSAVSRPKTTSLICMAGETSQTPRQAVCSRVKRPSAVVSPTLIPNSVWSISAKFTAPMMWQGGDSHRRMMYFPRGVGENMV